jgi:hypothetical protein
MKKVSQIELKRLKKKGKVRKKMGVQPEKEKPANVGFQANRTAGAGPYA